VEEISRRLTGLIILPNPAVDHIRVKGSWEQGKEIVISIFNQAGHLVKCECINDIREGEEISMDISFLPVGLYILSAEQGNQEKTGKVIILSNH
jgi:hypothetical protein